jgi:predicted nucleotide-binding protein
MPPRLTREEVIRQLQAVFEGCRTVERLVTAPEHIEDEPEMYPTQTYTFQKWYRDTLVTFNNVFGPTSQYVEELERISFGESSPRVDVDNDLLLGCIATKALLDSIIQEVKNYWDDNMVPMPSATAERNDSGSAVLTTRKVFVVHGHDGELRQTVARFLERLEFEPIILAEQADQGMTIIEKFDQYADVSFAVALFTPDDLGEAKTRVSGTQDLKHRARQNVLFELGYFIGRLGRSKACALVKGHVDMLSDYAGVLYIPVDDGSGWQLRLAKELSAAKFEVDLNRLLSNR